MCWGIGLSRSACGSAKFDGEPHDQCQDVLDGAGDASHTSGSHTQDLHRYRKARTDQTLIELLESLE